MFTENALRLGLGEDVEANVGDANEGANNVAEQVEQVGELGEPARRRPRRARSQVDYRE